CNTPLFDCCPMSWMTSVTLKSFRVPVRLTSGLLAPSDPHREADGQQEGDHEDQAQADRPAAEDGWMGSAEQAGQAHADQGKEEVAPQALAPKEGPHAEERTGAQQDTLPSRIARDLHLLAVAHRGVEAPLAGGELRAGAAGLALLEPAIAAAADGGAALRAGPARPRSEERSEEHEQAEDPAGDRRGRGGDRSPEEALHRRRPHGRSDEAHEVRLGEPRVGEVARRALLRGVVALREIGPQFERALPRRLPL